MNFVGAFMFTGLGATAIHYWSGFNGESYFDDEDNLPQREVFETNFIFHIIKDKIIHMPFCL